MHAKDIEKKMNENWELFLHDTGLQKAAREFYASRMAEFIRDPQLRERLTPTWDVGCRRVTPGDPYMMAIQEANVNVHFAEVAEITEDGAIGADGIERKCDTIVCATGFDVSFRSRFPIIGAHGVNLAEKWKGDPEAYLGLGNSSVLPRQAS